MRCSCQTRWSVLPTSSPTRSFLNIERTGGNWFGILDPAHHSRENGSCSHRFPRTVSSSLSGNIQRIPRWLSDKESTCQCRRYRRRGFDPWVGKIPWRRTWQPTPVFLPGESHGWRSLAGYSPWGHTESDMTERLNIIQRTTQLLLVSRREQVFKGRGSRVYLFCFISRNTSLCSGQMTSEGDQHGDSETGSDQRTTGDERHPESGQRTE